MAKPAAKVAVGYVFTRLTVVEDLGVVTLKPGYRRRMATFSCSCGAVVNKIYADVQAGAVKSCGCLQKEGRDGIQTHGKSDTPTYHAWKTMLARCHNPASEKYADYGGRGIKVCERWSDFENFFADMGERPEGKTLDRFPNNDGDYEPNNCRWATPAEQARNKRNNIMLSFGGKTQCLSDWAKELGIPRKTLAYRIDKGWTLGKALQPTS